MKRFFSIILVVTFALTGILNAQNAKMNNTAVKFYNEGNKLLNSGNYKGAIEKYNEALKTSTDYRIYYQKGISLKRMSKYVLAEQAFLSSIKSKPDFAIGYNGLGTTYFFEGKYKKAAQAFIKFSELAKSKDLKGKAKEFVAMAYSKLGEKAKANGSYKKAIGYLTKAISYYKLDATYLSLAQIYVETAQYHKALLAADNALNYRKSISKGGPLYYKGMAFEALGDKVKAKESFKAGLKDPKYRRLCKYELKKLNRY